MSTILSLPESCRTAVLKLLHSALPDTDAMLASQCLHEVMPLYTPGMSEAGFVLRARGAVYAFVQRKVAERAHDDPAALRRHILMTLQRCVPTMITKDMIDRCLAQLMQQPDANDPMHTCAIHQFAASELLAEPSNDDPMAHRLHESALRHLPLTHPVTRDDIRLVSLDALCDPAWLHSSSHAASLRLRLGLMGSRQHSCEEIAARMHLPLDAVHAIEANELFALSRRYRLRRYLSDA